MAKVHEMAGEYAYGDIADRLNDAGYRTAFGRLSLTSMWALSADAMEWYRTTSDTIAQNEACRKSSLIC